MLIQCKNCNVSFDDAFGKCVGCGEPVTFSPEELREKSIRMVEEWYREGRKTGSIRDELKSANLGRKEDIELIIRSAIARQRRAVRSLGRYIAGSGFLLLLAGIGLFILSLGQAVFYVLLSVGFALLVVGVLQSITGRNLAGYD